MATPTRTSAPRPRAAATKSSTARRKAAPKTTVEKAEEAVTGSAASLVDAVKASPIASAAIAAGVAGAGALIWAKRGQIAETAGVLGEKASELGSKLGDQASALGSMLGDQASALGSKVGEQASVLGGKISDQAHAIADTVGEKYAAATSTAPTQREIAEEALTLKEVGKTDPMLAEQSKVGSVSY